MFSRRDFFKRASMILAAATAAGTVEALDTDKLLYIPGAKKIFLPSAAAKGVFHGGNLGGGKTLRNLAALGDDIAYQAYKQAGERHYAINRYEVVTREEGGSIARVDFDSGWRPTRGDRFRPLGVTNIKGEQFSIRNAVSREDIAAAELYALDFALRDPESGKAGVFGHIPPKAVERFVMAGKVDATAIADVQDADSRPGEFTLYGPDNPFGKTVKGT